jgi:hypothetical protein
MIDFDALKSYEDYSKIKMEDILEFMKTKPAADREELKEFCAPIRVFVAEDGTEKERAVSFFEVRNWVLDKYYPGLRASKKPAREKGGFINDIMSL